MKHSTRYMIRARDLLALSLLAAAPAALAAEGKAMSWEQMHEKYTSAKGLLGGNVGSAARPVAQVTDLVLDADSNEVQYILAEVPYPYISAGGKDGFVLFDNVDIRDLGPGDVEIVIENPDSMRGPEELSLTLPDADQRLVSRVIGTPLHFGDKGARKVADLLIDRETGEVTHWVVDMDADSIFASERRAIPAGRISFGERAETTLTVADAESLNEFDPAYL